MESTKIYQTYQEVENNVKALLKDFEPVLTEVGLLLSDIEALDEPSKEHTLNKLVGHITKTARRHDIETKASFYKDYGINTIGTNHNGIGFVSKWGNQLETLSEQGRYGISSDQEQKLRKILFNEDATIELTSVIKKSNQKSFMKVLKILKKYGNDKAFGIFKKENTGEIEIEINQDYVVRIDLSHVYNMSFSLRKKDDTSYRGATHELQFDVEDNSKIINSFRNEKHDLLKDYSNTSFKNLDLNEIKFLCLLDDHKDTLLKEIKAKRTLIKSVSEGYIQEQKELKEMLEPFLALEKL